MLQDAPEKIVQFGEGNFLRAFADHFIDEMNEKANFNAKVVLVQPRGGHPETADRFSEQDGLYTLILRGRENGEAVERTRVISAASRCLDPKRDWAKLLDCARNPKLRFVISNTTEAGIAFDPACKAEDTPPSAFPAKLTLFLHERWKQKLPGVIVAVSQELGGSIVSSTKDIGTKPSGLLIADEDGRTSRPGVFAAGDAAQGARTVVEAVANGKRVAEAMHAYMQSLPMPESSCYAELPLTGQTASSALTEQILP